MVVIDEFYQIVEARTSKITPLWKLGHIVSFAAAAVCGFLTAFTFGKVLDDFGYNCILNAEIEFDNSSILNATLTGAPLKPIREIDLRSTLWGPSNDCDMVQFTPLIAMISAIIFGTYFAIMARGGAGYPTDLLSRPWTILYPCLFFSTIIFIICVISTEKLKSGMEGFCLQFNSEFNNTECVKEISVYIKQFKDLSETNISYYNFYVNQSIAIISSDIAIWAWVFQLVLCVVRICCVTDFDVQHVSIMTKEEVEQVVEPTDAIDDDED